MPERQTPIRLTRGNDVVLVFTIATSVAVSTAKFVVKRSAGTREQDFMPIGDEVILKVVTGSVTSDGQITTAGPPSAVIRIVLSKTNTAAFSAGKDVFYFWDLEIFDGSGNAVTPLGGPLTAFERARTATG